MATWDEPLQLLVRASGCNSTLKLNKNAIEKIKSIEKNRYLTVISVAGLYRSGKSYLLSRLIKSAWDQKNTGFVVRPTSDAVTKGIWVYYMDHPRDINKGILLLDSEGLGDPNTDNTIFDYRILCLTILLSSNFIYNHKHEIDASTINVLKISTGITDKITQESELALSFPMFTFVVRDFQSDLGEGESANEYMEKKLFSQRTGANKEDNNLVVKFRSYFLRRNCFLLDVPAKKTKDMDKIHTLSDEELEQDFINAFKSLYDFVIINAPNKIVNASDRINGERFARLTETFVEQVNKQNKFAIGDALAKVGKAENKNALAGSIHSYNDAMNKALATEMSLKAIVDAHVEKGKEAVKEFTDKVMDTDVEDYFRLCQTELRHAYVEKVQHFIFKPVSSAEMLNRNEELEKLANDVKGILQHNDGASLADKAIDCLNKNDYHKRKFCVLTEYFNEAIEEHKRKKAKALAMSQKLKLNELEKLKKEGFISSSTFFTMTRDLVVLGGGVAATVAFFPAIPVAAAGAAAVGLYSAARGIQKLFFG